MVHTAVHTTPAEELPRRSAQDAARALAYLHSRKPAVVHRDVKPANFLVDRAWRVKACVPLQGHMCLHKVQRSSRQLGMSRL